MTLSARRVTVMVTVAGAVMAAVAAIGLTLYHLDRQKYQVPMPPPGASARQVVLAYLHALDAHDTATAEQLTTPSFRPETQSWLRSTASIRHITIQGVTHWSRQHEYDVNVTFRYASHLWTRDSSFPDGDHFWGYSLVSRHGRLLINGDGVG